MRFRSIFLSAVSDEFQTEDPQDDGSPERGGRHGDLREGIKSQLSTCGVRVKEQREDRQSGHGTLLRQLHDNVESVEAVVHLLGAQPGFAPRPTPVEEFADLLPRFVPEFVEDSTWNELSYTQWEVVFAWSLRRPVLLFESETGQALRKLENLQPDDPRFGQWKWLRLLERRGYLRARPFRNTAEAQLAVYRELSQAPDPFKPSNLRAPLGELFKGRVDELKRLEDLLLRDGHDGPAALVQPVATTALGGAGKTQTAIEFGHRHRHRFSALLFVRADSPETLRRELAGLIGALAIELPPDATDDQRAGAALDWLKANPGWYLVVDNVDTEEARAAVVERIGALNAGKIVITSRLRTWPGSVRTLDLGVLLRKDSIALLEAWTTRDGQRRAGIGPDPSHHADAADVAKLAETLGDLALALRQAAALIVKQGWTVREYLAAWNAAEMETVATFDAATLEYPRSLAKTWLTTWRHLPEPSRRVLEVLAQFGPEPIPRFLFFGKQGEFAGPHERDIPFGLQADAEPLWAELLEGAPLRDAIAGLTDTALATWVESRELAADQPGASGLTVHAVVQHVTRLRLQNHDVDMARARREFAARLPREVLPVWTMDYRTWPIWRSLADHISGFDRYGQVFEDVPSYLSYLLDRLATFYQCQAAYGVAEPLFRRALAISEGKLGPAHWDVANRLNNLALLLRMMGQSEDAEPLYRQALKIHEATLGPDHPTVATDLNNLAILLQEKGELDDAEPLFRRVIRIDETVYGPDHLEVATDLNNLAILLQEKGELDDAESLFRQAIKISEVKLGSDHPSVATQLNNLASLLERKGELDEASPLFRRAIKIGEAKLGLDHPDIAYRLNNLALLLQAKGALGQAESLYHRALTIVCSTSRKFEGLHPHVRPAARNYAICLAKLGRSEAEIARQIRDCGWDDAWGEPPTGKR